jgi:hypothetical protein
MRGGDLTKHSILSCSDSFWESAMFDNCDTFTPDAHIISAKAEIAHYHGICINPQRKGYRLFSTIMEPNNDLRGFVIDFCIKSTLESNWR